LEPGVAPKAPDEATAIDVDPQAGILGPKPRHVFGGRDVAADRAHDRFPVHARMASVMSGLAMHAGIAVDVRRHLPDGTPFEVIPSFSSRLAGRCRRRSKRPTGTWCGCRSRFHRRS